MVPINENTNSGYHISVTMFGSSHMINFDQSLAKLRLIVTGSGCNVTEHAQKLGAWASWFGNTTISGGNNFIFNQL